MSFWNTYIDSLEHWFLFLIQNIGLEQPFHDVENTWLLETISLSPLQDITRIILWKIMLNLCWLISKSELENRTEKLMFFLWSSVQFSKLYCSSNAPYRNSNLKRALMRNTLKSRLLCFDYSVECFWCWSFEPAPSQIAHFCSLIL